MMKEFIVKMLGSHKLKLSSGMLKLAACFVDYEAEYLPPDSRIVEYGYTFSKLMNHPKGKILDVGCIARHNYIIPSLSFSGWEVTGIDIRSEWSFHHPNFRFMRTDIRSGYFPYGYFDVITCISTIEHIGLAGYYGNAIMDNQGDKDAITEMRRVLKDGGRLILTVPYSNQQSIEAGTRIYNKEAIEELVKDFKILDKVVYGQSDSNGEWNIIDVDNQKIIIGDKEWRAVTTKLNKENVICLELQK
jgi:SAM-dependent methyltransferase